MSGYLRGWGSRTLRQLSLRKQSETSVRGVATRYDNTYLITPVTSCHPQFFQHFFCGERSLFENDKKDVLFTVHLFAGTSCFEDMYVKLMKTSVCCGFIGYNSLICK